MNRKNIKLKIPVPANSAVYAEKEDKTKDLLLYEADQLEILEEVDISKSNNVSYQVKDGQFVNKGDVIFTEGLLSHKAMVADFNGIIEISENFCRILGQKRHIERRINLDGEIIRVVPNKFIEIKCNLFPMNSVYYSNFKTLLTKQKYFPKKDGITQDQFGLANSDTTYFINDNLYVEDLAKLIAFGAKRLIVNGVFVDDIFRFRNEIAKLESFAVISGYGEFAAKYSKSEDSEKDILWGKNKLYLSDEFSSPDFRTFEHPFWGISGKSNKKSELIGELEYNGELIEFYLKNLKENE